MSKIALSWLVLWHEQKKVLLIKRNQIAAIFVRVWTQLRAMYNQAQENLESFFMQDTEVKIN